MKFSLTALSTKDLAALCQRTMIISEEPAFAVVKDNPLLGALKTIYNSYDEVYSKKGFSGKGPLLVQGDDNRDKPFGALKSILLGHARATSSPYSKEARELYTTIEKYGLDLNEYKYAEETAQLKKLLEELERPENKTKLAHLLLTEVMTQIKTAQDDFEKLFNSIAGENAGLHLLDSASTMRKRLEVSLRSYLTLVTAMNTQPGWRELHAKIEEAVKAAMNSKPSGPKTDTTTETK